MRWVVASSARLAVVVLVVVGLVLGAGAALLSRAPVDTLPELLPPQVQVQTDAIGLSSGEAEQFLTVPAEYELATVAFLDSLKSRSVPGLSAITLTFKPTISVWTARQLVSERMAQVPLPVDVGTPPVMIQPLSSAPRAMMLGLTSTAVKPIDLTTLAKWRIRPRLLAVPGVANVTMWGQRDREMLVQIDPLKMAQRGVTLDQVMTTVGDSMWTSPLTFVPASSPGADGLIDTPNQRLTIQHILPIVTSKDLANVPIEGTGAEPVLVGDVATVVEDRSVLTGDAVVHSGPGLILVVEKLPGADALAVDRGVEAAMDELKPGLSGITVDASLFRPSTFLVDSLRAIGVAGLLALLIASVWLGVVFRSWRAAFASVVSIAASLLAACLVLYAMGRTFNALTVVGLVMALGIIVDDSVAGAAALRRRMAEAAAAGEDVPTQVLVTEALVTGRGPRGFVFAALLVLAAPLFFLPDVAGTLTAQAAVAYLVAVVASTVVSATVASALSVLLMPRRPLALSSRRSVLSAITERAVHLTARRPAGTVIIAMVFVVLTAAALWLSAPQRYVPSLRDGSLVVHWQAASGTSLDEMRRITSSAENQLRALPGVRAVSSHVGRALSGDQVVGSDAAETWLSLDSGADYPRTLAAVRRILADFPGYGHRVESYADNTIASAAAELAGSGPDLTLRVYGSNAETLRASAQKVSSAIAEIPGVANTRVTTTTEQPLIQVQTDIKKAAKYGLKPGDIRRQTAALVGGILVGSYYQDQQVFDVAVWSGPAIRQNPGDIAKLPIFAADGKKISLDTVAAVSMKPTPAIIDREKASRFVDVTAQVIGANPAAVTDAVREKTKGLSLPLGYHVEVSSPLQRHQDSVVGLVLVGLAAIVGMYLLLQAAFQSWRRATLVTLTLPFALSGSALVAAGFGWGLSLGVVAGFLVVLGVALRSNAALVARIAEGGDAPHARGETEMVATAVGDEATAVLATSVGVALLVVPFLVLNVSGVELLRPFAAVVIGGLVTSAVLTLLIMPTAYGRWGVSRTHRLKTEGEQL